MFELTVVLGNILVLSLHQRIEFKLISLLRILLYQYYIICGLEVAMMS